MTEEKEDRVKGEPKKTSEQDYDIENGFLGFRMSLLVMVLRRLHSLSAVRTVLFL
jgi:hypothetical protein